MEALILSLINALVATVPQLIEAIDKSTTMSEEEKKAALLALNIQLSAASVKVSQVRFKDVPLVGTTGPNATP